MKLWKEAAGLFVLLAGLISATANAQSDASDRGTFVEILNQCLAERGAMLVECAKIASLEAGNAQFTVQQKFDLSAGDHGSQPQQMKIYGFCKNGPDGGGQKICSVYECSWAGWMPSCRHIGYCSNTSQSSSGFCPG